MIKFNKFWGLLASTQKVVIDGKEINLNLSRLIELTGINTSVFDAMRNGEGSRRGSVSMESIERLCDFFDCQPSDLMEYIDD